MPEKEKKKIITNIKDNTVQENNSIFSLRVVIIRSCILKQLFSHKLLNQIMPMTEDNLNLKFSLVSLIPVGL